MYQSIKTALLCAASLATLASAANAQSQSGTEAVEQVVVTGSRVISDAANSPTPLTEISKDQLLATTPSNIPDALNTLPVFQGSSGLRNATANASTNAGGNVLSLRDFGRQRTLVLFDGHRVTPSNADGTVDTDVIPQMLIQRVDVVTGGASAVYGSDAVTGVVNFVLDKRYDGLKIDANAGISKYADAMSYQFGAAAGTDLFGGRGHIEGSIRHYSSDPVFNQARPLMYNGNTWNIAGSGSATNPYVNVSGGRRTDYTFGGLIGCKNCGTLNGQEFVGNGIVAPFTPGTPTAIAGLNVGGDGVYVPYNSALGGLKTDESFGRFSYNLNDTIELYVQANANQSVNTGHFYPTQLFTGANQPNTFYKTNPYLPASVAAQMNSPTFTLTEFINDQGPHGDNEVKSIDRDLGVTVGADGTIGNNYNWDLYYTHGESRLHVDNINNPNQQKLYAQEDAVLNSAGQVVCYVSTTSSASLYPGCVPLNPFGPTAVTSSAYKYWNDTTYYNMLQTMDDAGASITGTLLTLPAGVLKTALSAGYRNLTYDVISPNPPSATVDCTGLRLCSPATLLYGRSTIGSVSASEHVWEVAGEAEIPLLKDLPMVQSFDANLAGRYTDYSVSGSVQTWKIGLDWHVIDDLRFRATTSVDIRAPTLNDLYSPPSGSSGGFYDIHTNFSASTITSSQGNSALVPEVARTYTVGAVLTPTFLPGLTASIDYYQIKLSNAITNISGTNTQIANLCEQSGGTSLYCSLYVRPLPFSNTTPANYPTIVKSEVLNSAFNAIGGEDIEVNYQFEMADILPSAGGTVNLRALANIQPVNTSQIFPGAAFTYATVPKGHFTGMIGYSLGDWTFNLTDRWFSSQNRSSQPATIFYAQPTVPATNYVDAGFSRRFKVDGADLVGSLTVQNLFNNTGELDPTLTTNPGYSYPIPPEEDIRGRYFTLGIRAEL